MPLYHYECRNCGHDMELRQGFHEAAPACPVCSTLMRRRLFPVGVVFKGSGFYSTDHRSGAGSARSGKAEAEDGAGPEAKEGNKESSTNKVEAD